MLCDDQHGQQERQTTTGTDSSLAKHIPHPYACHIEHYLQVNNINLLFHIQHKHEPTILKNTITRTQKSSFIQ